MNRRRLLKHLSLAAVGSMAIPSYARSEFRKLKQFGVQLSTITPMMAADFAGTLAEVASIGYKQVEFSALGFLGREAAEAKDLLDKNGLEAPVGRVAFNVPADFMTMPRDQQMKVFGNQTSMESLVERINTSLEECKLLDQRYLIIPAIMSHVFSDMTQVKNMIATLQESAKKCQDQGVMLGYHNHNWEFDELDGKIPYTIMLEELDPELFTFQLDTYWVRKAGWDLTEILNTYSGRFITCHLKDIDNEGDFEDVGHGEIDFPAFLKKAQSQGAKYFFVERDTSDDPMESIRRSYASLKDMRF